MSDWNPELYLKFERERTQPVKDLVARIEVSSPARIVDLGCGPGNSTLVLRERWPGAAIVGVDNSPAMLERARKSNPGIEWIQADAGGDLSPLGPFDIVLANASLQWLPDHRSLMPRLLRLLNPGGALAIQIPRFEDMPMARIIQEATKLAEYAEFFAGFKSGLHCLGAEGYYDTLCEASRRIDLWETHYYHVLADHPAIMDWTKSTALRPFLDCLPEDRQAGFMAEVLQRVKEEYPARRDGRVLFVFKRFFLIASAAH
jgi:trans-aconitate 2-methyltransferase